MKTSLAVAVGTVVLLAAGMPLAQGTKAPASKPGATASQSGPAVNMGSHMGQMDEHIQTMQALHEKIAGAPTPGERQKLMQEQRAQMQAGMGMMNQVGPGGGMSGGMEGGMMTQKGKPADAGAQLQMMQKRMDLMQTMMQSMLDQLGMMAGPGSPEVATRK